MLPFNHSQLLRRPVFVAAGMALLFSGLPAVAQAGAIEQDGIRVEYGTDVPEASARVVLNDELAARERVSTVLGIPAPKLITIRIDNGHDGIPYSDDDTLYAPQSRLDWPRTSKDGRPRDNLSLVHETTHIIDSGKLKNRFLTEGLAVYMSEHVGMVGYPNQGVDLHVCTRQLQQAYADPVPILDSEKVREAAESGVGRQLAYTQEGSFTRWLIETYGLPRFQRVLDAELPEKVYGKTFAALEAAWRGELMKITVTGPSCVMTH